MKTDLNINIDEFKIVKADIFKSFRADYIEIILDQTESIYKVFINDKLMYKKNEIDFITYRLFNDELKSLCKVLRDIESVEHTKKTTCLYHCRGEYGIELYRAHFYKMFDTTEKIYKIVGFQQKIIDMMLGDSFFHEFFSKCKIFLLIRNKDIVYSFSKDAYVKHMLYRHKTFDFFVSYLHSKFIEIETNETVLNLKGVKILKRIDKEEYYKLELDYIDKSSRLFYCTLTDFTVDRKNIVELENLATKDSLTGLYSRFGGMKLVDRYKNFSFFAIIDMNDFKNINDVYGHLTGDNVLIEFSKIIKNCFSKGFIKIRLGGDEFVILGKLNETKEMLEQMFQDFFNMIKQNEFLSKYNVSCFVGCELNAEYDDTSKNNLFNFESFYEKADKKMYLSKRQNGNYITI